MGGRAVVTTFKQKEVAIVKRFLAEMEDPDPETVPLSAEGLFVDFWLLESCEFRSSLLGFLFDFLR